MVKAIESMGIWMLDRIVPTVSASADCAATRWCRVCSQCYTQWVYVRRDCSVSYGACSSCSSASAPAGALC